MAPTAATAAGPAFDRAFGARLGDICSGVGAACEAGSRGGAAGEFNSPHGIAVSDGEVYVADADNQRISVFSAAGRFVRAFGKGVDPSVSDAGVCTSACEAGSQGAAAGQLNNPTGVAVSGGEVYVAEFGSHRISVFTTAGSFVRAFGSQGGAAGRLFTPHAVTVSGGEVYVADLGNHRISVFTTAGSFVRAFGKGVDSSAADADVCTSACEPGSLGGDAGRLTYPSGVGVSGGEVYVADPGNHRISVFTTAGSFVRTFGSLGGAAGQLYTPYGVVVSGGEIYIAELSNHRISVFTPAGTFVRAFGKGVDASAANADVCTGACEIGFQGVRAGELNTPPAVAVSAGEVFVTERPGDRVSVFTPGGSFLRVFGKRVGVSRFICTAAGGCEAGTAGGAAGQLDHPNGLTVSGGEVYVAERRKQRVSVFTAAGSFVRAFAKGVDPGAANADVCTGECEGGSPGGAAGQLFSPSGVAVGGGEIFVSELDNHRISVFTTAGSFVRAFGKGVDSSAANADVCSSACESGSRGGAPGQLSNPYAVAVSGGEVYVADQANHRISVFTTAGAFVRAFGSAGGAAGRLSSPSAVAVSGGEVFVADQGNQRISVFTPGGTFVRAFGKGVELGGFNGDVCTSACEPGGYGGAAGELSFPSGVSVRDSEVHVAEFGNHRISVFTTGGRFVRAFGKGVDSGAGNADVCTSACEAGRHGGAAGELGTPSGVAVSDGEIYVAERTNERISVFDIPPAEPARPQAPADVQPQPSPTPTTSPTASPSPSPAALNPSTLIFLPSAKKCVRAREFRIRIRQPAGVKLSSSVVKVNGKIVKRLTATSLTAPVGLRTLPTGKLTVVVEVRTSDGRTVKQTRRYRTCAPPRKR